MKFDREEFTHFFIIPIIIGIIGGFSAYIFRYLIKFFSNIYNKIDFLNSNATYIITIPVVFYISYKIISKTPINPSNITIDEIAKKILILGGNFSIIKGFLVFILASFAIGFGVPVGREGPIAKLGGLGSEIFLKIIHTPRINLPIYLSAGVSSAISATFNAPVAGIILGLEMIMGKINSYILIPLIVACSTATLISREIIGNFAAFYVPHLTYNNDYLFYVPVEGILFGILSLIFLFSIKEFRFLKYKYQKKWAEIIIFLGIIVGISIYLTPQIKGVGYSYIEQLFNNHFSMCDTLAITLSKLLNVIISIGSGLFGGVLSPSIFIGAFGGDFFGHLIPQLDPRVFALTGTAAMLSGVTKAPLRSSVIIVELTHSYQLILPILIASSVTNYIVSLFEPGFYFKRALLQKGIDIDNKKITECFTSEILQKHIIKTPVLIPEMSLKTAVKYLKKSKVSYLPVIENNKLIGIVSLRDIRKKFFIKKRLKVKNIMSKNPFFLKYDSSQKEIFKAISILNVAYIPYLDKNNNYSGMISLGKLLKDISIHIK